MERPTSIASARLDVVALLPAEIEALIAGDTQRASTLSGVGFPPDWRDDVDARDGLSWHLKALKGPPNSNGDAEIGWG